MKKMRTIIYFCACTLYVSSSLFAMHNNHQIFQEKTTELPGFISSPIPVRPPVPYEDLFPRRTTSRQDFYDFEAGISKPNSMNIRADNGDIFVVHETKADNASTDNVAKLITDTSETMLSKMHQEMQKTGEPIQKT